MYNNCVITVLTVLFNSLPKDLRDLHGFGVDIFKTKLDALLSRIQD